MGGVRTNQQLQRTLTINILSSVLARWSRSSIESRTSTLLKDRMESACSTVVLLNVDNVTLTVFLQNTAEGIHS